MKNLFGDEVSASEAKRLLKRKDPRPDGYSAPPGTGPVGETCKSCVHLFRNHQSKTYLKCNLVRHIWTGGRKTDVLASAPACRNWEVPV